MILQETKLASMILDGEEEETPATQETTEAEASATLLDGEEEETQAPAEGGEETPSESTEGTEEAM